jgi:predicted anti-sigma-YlaC factor YlaD
MNQEDHRRAERLILQKQVEGLSETEREWLERHLEECAECARMAGATGEALRGLRAVSVALPESLAARAQLRVYLRAEQMRGRQRAGWAPWLGCGISWALGVASAPYVWRGCRWLGEAASLPGPVWKMGFALWWAVPALLTVAALLIERRGGEGSERGFYDAGQ